MTLMLKRGVICVCLTAVALALPTPAFAAESGGTTVGVSQAQSAGICELFPMFWWCK